MEKGNLLPSLIGQSQNLVTFRKSCQTDLLSLALLSGVTEGGGDIGMIGEIGWEMSYMGKTLYKVCLFSCDLKL